MTLLELEDRIKNDTFVSMQSKRVKVFESRIRNIYVDVFFDNNFNVTSVSMYHKVTGLYEANYVPESKVINCNNETLIDDVVDAIKDYIN